MNATPDPADMADLDVLVNSAAILNRTSPFVDVDEVLWDLTKETNVKGVLRCCNYAIPAMTSNAGGSIVNVSSMSGIRGVGYLLPYGVSKAGVIHLTTVAARQ